MTMEFRFKCLEAAIRHLGDAECTGEDVIRLGALFSDFVVHGEVPYYEEFTLTQFRSTGDPSGKKVEGLRTEGELPGLGEDARTLDEQDGEELSRQLGQIPRNNKGVVVAAEETTHSIGDMAVKKRTEFAAPGIDLSAYAGSTNLPAKFDAAHDINAQFMDEHHGD